MDRSLLAVVQLCVCVKMVLYIFISTLKGFDKKPSSRSEDQECLNRGFRNKAVGLVEALTKVFLCAGWKGGVRSTWHTLLEALCV